MLDASRTAFGFLLLHASTVGGPGARRVVSDMLFIFGADCSLGCLRLAQLRALYGLGGRAALNRISVLTPLDDFTISCGAISSRMVVSTQR